ncbi:MAG: peptidylprolyl isomerase [Erysipelotrichaceae bacterium]|nr:peptidylprolyl isomerase [Erysipelotrichaceae bacterium]
MKLKRLLLLLFISVSLFGCASNSNLADDKNDTDVKTEYLSGKYYVEMDIKDYGVIDLELDADIAPITVTNFIDLVNKKFYDGLTFHRIIKNFMVQGGDPEGTGMGGSGTTIKGEFLNNGVKNSISHKRGVISMARSNISYNSASSQFFIMHKDSPELDGQYAAFGHVISGIEVVDKLVEVKVEDNNGTVLKENQPVITSIRVIDAPKNN